VSSRRARHHRRGGGHSDARWCSRREVSHRATKTVPRVYRIGLNGPHWLWCWGIVQPHSGSGRVTRTPHQEVAAVDPTALRVIAFSATETYAHNQTPETETPDVLFKVANATSVTLEGVGEVPCHPEGLKESPPVCADFIPLFDERFEAKGARKKALDAAYVAFARATSVTLTARGVDGKTLTATVPVESRPMPVEYVVTIGGWDGSVTVENPETGATEQAKVYKTNGGRWTGRYGSYGTRIEEGARLYLSAQNGDEGCVSVKIYIHNIEAKSAQSCGEFTIATISTNYVSAETLARLQADGKAEQ
jgi:hypothetical protein